MSLWRKLFGVKESPGPDLKLVKRVLREANGARDFVRRAEKAGFRFVKEDHIGLILAKGECKLILSVLPSRGPDTIWCLSLSEKKGSPIVNVIDEGKLQS
jgi:hypothetical protein